MTLQSAFAARLVAWQKQHGRHGLPWQVSDPYRVWLSEIMLQQTQVSTVLGYYARFLERFPDLATLAAAPVEDVLAHWSGLGYYTRARNLHKAAQQVMAGFGGEFPARREAIETLPGIGRSTAAAIAAFAFGQRETILDGNVKRVLTRCFGIDGYPGDKKVEAQLWTLAESLLPAADGDMVAYTQGLMDLGATVCSRSRPACGVCPMLDGCAAARDGRTAELPQRKPKKAQPQRETVMLIALHQGQVLLQRRPPSGIWGGLLSLPEFESTLAIADWLEDNGDGELLPVWPELRHVFTHFRLTITPQCVPLQRLAASHCAEDGHVWLPLAQALDAGVPTPVRKLLLQALQSPAGATID
ncbi:A/G-specific adenine glycosylase [Vogesella indigofera]|uniref:Adenine DNA glycosylase n=1 Tax=Vogesella indigofera TaxID=45465 RepID=A0ABT5I786_VOGIN|nr:A/G-specific adenine glycosylase [Vogesella indigofera]MDC7692030.1 A/G-specific adenine glycosylase [Vogesella indigofera]